MVSYSFTTSFHNSLYYWGHAHQLNQPGCFLNSCCLAWVLTSLFSDIMNKAQYKQTFHYVSKTIYTYTVMHLPAMEVFSLKL